MKVLLITLFTVCCFSGYCQNNPFIFFGGKGDGGSISIYAQFSSQSLVHGGSGDGFQMAYFNQQSFSIAHGGTGDGFSTINYVQFSDDRMNKGGNGDGFATINYIQQYVETLNHGGIGDGWASIIYELGPLPVTLLSFTGKKTNSGNILEWVAGAEQDVAFYQLQRSSDGRDYKSINNQSASNNSAGISSYQFLDQMPLSGNNFYRLQINDKDGNKKLSNIVLLRVVDNGETLITLYPNPAASLLNLKLTGIPQDEPIRLTIVDSKGTSVYNSEMKGMQSKQLAVSNLVKGTYILIIRYGDRQENIKFVKQ